MDRGPSTLPAPVSFATKGELAWAQLEAALAADIPRGPVLIDAVHGDGAALRDRLSAHDLLYAVGIRPQTAVWCDAQQPAPTPPAPGKGRLRIRVKRDAAHQPLSVRELALSLAAASYRALTWRDGTSSPLRSRFAGVRVRIAQADRVRAEELLLIEWPKGESEQTRKFLATLPAAVSLNALVNTVKIRWRIERDYLERKLELGLGDYEGRNWRGFHHHASLCVAAYGFLMLERLAGAKKDSAGLQAPALPKERSTSTCDGNKKRFPQGVMQSKLHAVLQASLAAFSK